MEEYFFICKECGEKEKQRSFTINVSIVCKSCERKLYLLKIGNVKQETK